MEITTKPNLIVLATSRIPNFNIKIIQIYNPVKYSTALNAYINTKCYGSEGAGII